MDRKEIEELFSKMLNVHEIERSSIQTGTTVAELLKKLEIRPSLNQVFKLIKQQSLKINNKKVENPQAAVEEFELISGCLYLINCSKKEYHAIILR